MKKKMLFIIIATIIALMFTVTTVMAADDTGNDAIDDLLKEEDTDTPTVDDAEDIEEGQKPVEEDKDIPANTDVNTNVKSNNQPTELVKTGAEEVSVTLVAILAASSIYAYKKVKEYNA